MFTGQLEQIDRAVDVRLGIKLRLRQRRTDTGARREVNDAIEFGLSENLFQSRCITNVGLKQAIVGIVFVSTRVPAFDCRVVEIIEIVNDGNAPLAFGQQTGNEAGTDKSSAA